MAFLIFDACALIALSEKEEGSDLLASFLEDGENTCFVHSINLCEVYYQMYREKSKAEAIAITAGFLDLGVLLRDDMDIEFLQAAGELKAIHKRVSLADCCAMALAKGLPVRQVPMKRSQYPSAIRTFRRLLLSEHPAILQVNSSRDSWIGSIASRLVSDRPKIIRMRHTSAPLNRSRTTRLLYRHLLDFVIVTGGERTKRGLVERDVA